MLIAGPNLTIDRTATIDDLRPGDVLRLTDVAVSAGGKGLNVARAATALGAPATLVAFLPGHTGRAAAALIGEEGVDLHGIPVPGEIRSTSVILEPSGRATVLNEPGPPLNADDWARLERAVRETLRAHDVLVCTGSLPPGAPDDGYARLTRSAHGAGRLTVVDASGAILEAALRARPHVITPNLAEAEGVLHGRGDESVHVASDARPRALAAARELVRRGARCAVVTAATAGAALAIGGDPVWLDAPPAHAVNPIGAGDVLAAALAAALQRGDDVHSAAREGMAAAAASVETAKGGHLDPSRMHEILARTASARWA
jgi:1-phosphofructokinase family hexose kinase